MPLRIRTVVIPVVIPAGGLGTRPLPLMRAMPKELRGALPALEASVA